MDMNPWIQLGSVMCATVLASWTIHHARKKDDDAKRMAVWRRLDTLRAEVQAAQRDLAVLRERLAAMPSRDVLDLRLQSLETKLEGKMDALGEQLRELFKAALEVR